MKKTLTLFLFSLAFFPAAFAQRPPLFNASETLDAGNIVVPHFVHGDMWWNTDSAASPMEFPKGVTGQLHGLSTIWMGGRNQVNSLRAAAQYYRSHGTDFWPGPIDTFFVYSHASSPHTQSWARIWNIRRTTVAAFRAMPTHTLANTPAIILEWPGRGNIHARGANGTSLKITREMAPFVDLDSNGIYEPLKGEYPAIKGDQMLWWVINDYSGHAVTYATEIGAEIRISAYAFSSGTLADNIIFYEYELQNRGTENLGDFIFASVADLDVDLAFNDYAGFDSVSRLAVIYDRHNYSGQSRGAAGGYVLLDQPGDSLNRYTKAGAMNVIYNQMPSDFSDPQFGEEYYKILNGLGRLGTAMNPGSRYAVPGLDFDCATRKAGQDQRIVLATQPRPFAVKERLHFAFALVAADSIGMCQGGIDFTRLQQTADTAYKIYWTPGPAQQPNRVLSPTGYQVEMFPNPARQTLYVRGRFGPEARLLVLNAVGASFELPATSTAEGFELNIATLPPGMYHLRVTDGRSHGHCSFIRLED